MATHYEILGVPEGASDAEVRQAYRRLVKAAHPDRAGDPTQFRVITQAYDVLTDPVERAAYDRSLRGPATVRARVAPVTPPRPAPRPRKRRHYGRYAVVSVAVLVVVGVLLGVAADRRPVGDPCLVGTWRGEAFQVPFRALLDGREVSAPLLGGAGATLTVAANGTVRTDYSGAAPFVGNDGGYRIEGAYVGTTTERWHVEGFELRQTTTDASHLAFRATINGRPPDQPLAPTLVDRQYPYTCSPTTLELGPYRYTRG